MASLGPNELTHLPQCRIYTSVNWVCIGSGNGLSPVRRQAIIWTNAGLLWIGLLGTNFNAIWISILSFSFQENVFENVACQNGGHFAQGGWVNGFLPICCHHLNQFRLNCRLDLQHVQEQTSVMFGSKYNNLHARKCFRKCHQQNGSYFVLGFMHETTQCIMVCVL